MERPVSAKILALTHISSMHRVGEICGARMHPGTRVFEERKLMQQLSFDQFVDHLQMLLSQTLNLNKVDLIDVLEQELENIREEIDEEEGR